MFSSEVKASNKEQFYLSSFNSDILFTKDLIIKYLFTKVVVKEITNKIINYKFIIATTIINKIVIITINS